MVFWPPSIAGPTDRTSGVAFAGETEGATENDVAHYKREKGRLAIIQLAFYPHSIFSFVDGSQEPNLHRGNKKDIGET